MKVLVKIRGCILDGTSGRISFTVKNEKEFPEGMVKAVIPALEKLIAHELETAYLLSEKENKGT